MSYANAFVEAVIDDAQGIIIRTEMGAKGKYGRLRAWFHPVAVDGSSKCLYKLLIVEGTVANPILPAAKV